MDTLIELKAFYEKMVKYKKLVREWAHVFIASEAIVEKIQSLRTELQRTYSRLQKDIARYGGKDSISYGIFGREQDVFDVAFDALDILNFANRQDALDKAMKIVNKAIGKLEAGRDRRTVGVKWTKEDVIRRFQEALHPGVVEGDKQEQGPQQPTRKVDEPIRAFIAHEGMTRALKKVEGFLNGLGIQSLIAEIEPSDGRSVERQIQWTQGQADFAIILATKGKAINRKTGKPYMGLNIADELGRAREVFKNRVILLLQKGVEPHTNVSGIVYAIFTPQSMEGAFTKIVKELENWRYI